MRWSKIKNIIILLLVIVNGFLLAQVGLRHWQSERGERETRQRVITILERNGVEYLPAQVPGDLDLLPRRVTPAPLGEAEAAVLVGPLSGTQTAGNRTLYTGAEGTAAVTSAGELAVEYLPGSAPSESELLDRLSRLGIALRKTGLTETAEETSAHYVQLWNGVPIPGETVLITWEDSILHTLSLRLLTGTEELLPAEETITASTALARLLDELSRGEGYVCSQITDMYPGYLASGTAPVTLTPAWFIETDAWRFIVDGVTGAVTATE